MHYGNVDTIPFPPNGKMFRGTGLPDPYLDFFQPGKVFRYPGFVATTPSRETAQKLMHFADSRNVGAACIMVICLDPDGEHNPARRCFCVWVCVFVCVTSLLYAHYVCYTHMCANNNSACMLVRRCKHLILPTSQSRIINEQEYVFLPYSPFTVTEVSVKSGLSLGYLCVCM
jgi:hypothetical protein